MDKFIPLAQHLDYLSRKEDLLTVTCSHNYSVSRKFNARLTSAHPKIIRLIVSY